MKPAFKIRHKDAVISNDTHVLIEVGDYSISTLLFKKDPLAIEGVTMYHMPADSTGDALLENALSILNDNEIKKAGSVNVFFNCKESLLVPAEFFNPHQGAEYLNLIYGLAPGTFVAHDDMQQETGLGKEEKLHNVYRVDAKLMQAAEAVSTGRPRHSTTVQVNPTGVAVLHCNIFHNSIKVFLYNATQLLIVQQFTYKTPSDVVYHLLNTCDKFEISPSEVNLQLDGMIDSDSSLYEEIYKYFLNVQFNMAADDIFLSDEIKEHPLHFISHLTELARCV